MNKKKYKKTDPRRVHSKYPTNLQLYIQKGKKYVQNPIIQIT